MSNGCKITVRPCIDRLAKIAKAARSRDGFRVEVFAVEEEITTKTVYRDLAFLRDRLGHDLTFNTGNTGPVVWRYRTLPETYLL